MQQGLSDLSASYTFPSAMFVVRGATPSADRFFVISGTDFLEIDSAGSITDRGNLSTADADAQIVRSGDGLQLGLTPQGTEFHTYILASNTLSGVVSGVTPSYLTSLDGYFIAGKTGTGQFCISASNDGSSWDSLDFTTAEASPDDCIGVIADHGELWIQGTDSIQVYRNTGNADFPFDPIPGGRIEYGVLPGSMVRHDNSLLFIGVDSRGGLAVYRIEGYTPIRVSNHAIEELLAALVQPERAHCFSYSDRGHSFYVMGKVVPNSGSSMSTSPVFDSATGLWHERGRWDGAGTAPSDFEELEITSHVYAFGKHLVGISHADHKAVYEMDLDTFTDVAAPSGNSSDLIGRLRRAPNISNENRRVFYDFFELDIDENIDIDLSWSNDGGLSFGTALSLSAQSRMRWTQLGSGRDRVFQIWTTDSSHDVAIANAYLKTRAGLH